MWIISRLRKRRSTKPAWDSLSREEQGIVAHNSRPGAYGTHESAKAAGSGGPTFGPDAGRR